MNRKTSIAVPDLIGFLASGACLRIAKTWYLVQGPFKPVSAENSSKISICCVDFYGPEQAFISGQVEYQLDEQELKTKIELALQALHEQQGSQAFVSRSWVEPSQKDFAESLATIQSRIRKNEISKAVPVVFARSTKTFSHIEILKSLQKLVTAPQNLFVYGFWDQQSGILGATPEILFSQQNELLRTMALAGTCPKSEIHSRKPLLNDEKELEEHNLVVQDLRKVLAQFGDVHVDGPKILELATLLHLQSDFVVHTKAKWKSFQAMRELVTALHPTPALGVFPRSAGWKWMQSLPGQQQRKRFGAPFGFAIDDEICQVLVAIRNIQWDSEACWIGSGCGIVAASELEQEWRELRAKRDFTKRILGIEV